MVTFRYRLTWFDIDYARVAHYLRYFVWVDEAFHRYLYERGFHIKEFMEQGYGLPYVASACRYLQALTLEDEVEIQATVTDLTPKGFTLRYRILRAGDSTVVAEGETGRRCIRREPRKSVEMPALLSEILKGIAAEGDSR